MIRVALPVLLALALSGCTAGPGGPLETTDPMSTAPSSSSAGACPTPPLVGHWRMSEGAFEDFFGRPAAMSEPAPYAYRGNGTSANGTYQVVHEDHDKDCNYQTVAFLVFLREEPGVVTWRYETTTSAEVENEGAWTDRPATFKVEFVDDSTAPG